MIIIIIICLKIITERNGGVRSGVAVHGTGNYSLVDQYAEYLTPTAHTEDALPRPVHAHR
jgi:hypothetical protein